MDRFCLLNATALRVEREARLRQDLHISLYAEAAAARRRDQVGRSLNTEWQSVHKQYSRKRLHQLNLKGRIELRIFSKSPVRF